MTNQYSSLLTELPNNANVEKHQPLLHELQLGEQLNECVHSTRRADFSLMLAMLVDDVREHSQFSLPQQAVTQSSPTTNQALRKQFELAQPAPLALNEMADVESFNQASHVENDELATIRLSNALAPKPLAFRDNAKHINSQVMENTSLYCQLKHQQGKSETDDKLGESLNFKAKEWLNAVHNSLVKAPLVTC